MSNLVKVKLRSGQVIDGGVWLKGSTVFVTPERAKLLVDAKEAEYVKEPAPSDQKAAPEK